jgi:MinD-like ATPase involved in chromosome partitioning or flagellar assembly
VLRGCLTAVTGPVDGQGASEVAVELAVALRRRGESAVLVDADLVAASLAQRLGVGFDRNLHTAVDAVVHRSGSLEAALVSPAVGGFELLAGLPARKWAEVDAEELAAVLEALLGVRGHVLCNVAAAVEDLPGGRHAVTRRVLAAADRIVCVADATPAGCERVCRWLGDVAELVDDLARVHVVFNRSPRRAEAAAELEAELARCATVGGVTTLPYDAKVVQACWAGEAVAPGRFTRAVAALAEAALPRSQPAPSRRRRLARVVGR